VVTVYESVECGRFRPILPGHCPFGGDGEGCRVGAHGRRERQQGPEFALVVAVCHAHRRYFTLYPPGWTPWGRIAVQEPSAADSWKTTMFAAALDAAAGRLWPVESLGALGCAKTQGRWIHRCGQWLGIAGSVSELERAAGAVGIPLAALRDAHFGFIGTGRRAGGGVIAGLLQERSWTAADWRGLLIVGGQSGGCGRAWITGADGVTQPVFPA
jgi:hypothetical protein